jgi:hypothetical protein
MDERNHIKITQRVPRQHTRKARNQGITENSHMFGKVLMQKYFIFNVEINLHVPKIATTE